LGAAFFTTLVADFLPTAKVIVGAVKAEAEPTKRAKAGANFMVSNLFPRPKASNFERLDGSDDIVVVTCVSCEMSRQQKIDAS
jgi:hypothetical protein